MRSLVGYTTRAWRISCLLTIGKWPLTSPGLTAANLDLMRLSAEIVYIRLHGMPGQHHLYGDPGWPTALSAVDVASSEAFRKTKLVFLEGCFGQEMADAFLAAGAQTVIGSDRITWSRALRVGPASKVGQKTIAAARKGKDVSAALLEGLTYVAPIHALGWAIAGDERMKLK